MPHSTPATSATPAREDLFAQAVSLHGLGQVARALDAYMRLLRETPVDGKVAELAGIACMQLERHREAILYLRQAQKIDPNNAQLYNNLGVSLKFAGELSDGIDALQRALRLQPDYPEAQVNLGMLLEDAGEFLTAATACLRALASDSSAHERAVVALRRLVVRPEVAIEVEGHLQASPALNRPEIRELLALARAHAAPLTERMSPRTMLERSEQALGQKDFAGATVYMERFLKKDPSNAAGWNNLGVVYRQAGDQAAAARAFQRAADLDPDLAFAWNNLGACLLDVGDLMEARRALESALALAPHLANIHANLGMLARALHDAPRAMQCYRRALELDGHLFEAHLNLGNLHYEFGDEHAAHAAFSKASALRPDDPESTYNEGVTHVDPAAATVQLDHALALRTHYPEAEVARVFMQLKACDWTDLSARLRRVEVMATDPAMPALAPFWILALTDSRRTQQLVARKWARDKILPGIPATRQRARIAVPKHASRIRVGLLSGDLRDHAVGHLLADVLPRMDTEACELWAYDVSPEDGSPVRATILSAFQTVRSVGMLGSAALAERIQADGVDVLVDLSGYSQHSRSGVLGLRPAPVQASYLGFPGTMGWDAVDCLLADDYLIPPSHEQEYDEHIVRLPLFYQPARRFALNEASRPTRAAMGLPDRGLVLASFGNPYKFRPELFASWLRVLAAHPGSVLWLARFNEPMEKNLRGFARAHGVDPARLVFAPVSNIDQHLARLPLADLCLDTAPYGSGVTATQALYAGVPLLTLDGETYVGRMAASLLHALSLPALIAKDVNDYETRAMQLASDAGLRRQLREALAAARAEGPVFDVDRSARDLAHAFAQLAQSGRGPLNG